MNTIISDSTDLTKPVEINIGTLKEQVVKVSNTQTKNKIKVTLACMKDKTLVATGLQVGDAAMTDV